LAVRFASASEEGLVVHARTATRIPSFTPSLSRSDGGFLIFSAHLAARAELEHGGPIGNVTRNLPSVASSFEIDFEEWRVETCHEDRMIRLDSALPSGVAHRMDGTL
jgi:hypothetical protein